MSLNEYLKIDGRRDVRKGALGKETGWIPFDELKLRSGKLFITDPIAGVGMEEGLGVELPPADYRLEAKVMDYGQDKRISRLRIVLPDGDAEIGEQIGSTWTDVGSTGVCDHEDLAKALEDYHENRDALYDRVDEEVWRDGIGHGSVILDEKSSGAMHVVNSGFGDGEFPVYELLSASGRVGCEIEFISRGTPYPF